MYNGHIVISGNWNGTLGDFRRIAVLWRMICLLAAATLVACGGDQTEAPSAPGSSPQPTVMPEQSPVATPTPAGPGVTPADTTAPQPTPSPTLPATPTSPQRSVTEATTPSPPATREATPTATRPPPIREVATPASPTPMPAPFTAGELNFPNPHYSQAETSTAGVPVDFAIDETTLWKDVIAKLGDEEVACIGSELGEERYQWVLERHAMQDASMGVGREQWAEFWQVLLWACLEQETAVDLFLANSKSQLDETIDSMRGFLLGPKEDEEELLAEDCLRELLAYTDYSRFVTAGMPGKSGESRAHQEYEGASFSFIFGLASCAETPYQSGTPPEESEDLSFLSDYDISWRMVVEGISGPESDCIGEELAKTDNSAIDQQVFDGSSEPWEISAWGCISQENAAHLFEASDPFLDFAIGRERILEYSGDDIKCARDVLLRVDYPRLVAAGIPSFDPMDGVPYFALDTALAYCWPGELEGYDGYINDPVGVVQLAVGDSVNAAIDYPDDDDWYRFDARGGRNYHIEISSATVRLAGTALFGPDGEWLDTGDDRRQSGVFEINWNAPFSGEFYFSVYGWENLSNLGLYRASLSESTEIEDDHSDSREDATHFEVGDTVQGVLGYGKDADFLSFTAIGERAYEITGTWDSGSPLRFNVYDDDWWRLGSTINRLGEPVILWLPHAERQWPVLIAVGEHAKDRGLAVGYSLTVSLSDINDDHANTEKYATYIDPGERIEASIDYPGDSDHFHLRGENGESYRFEVTAASADHSIGVGTFDPQKDDYVGGTSVVIDTFDRNSPDLSVGSIRDEVRSYTLIVSPSDIADDHGDLVAGATRISLGTPTAGNLEHAHDWDILCFPAVKGVTYEVELSMGSLKYARLGVYDSSTRSHSAQGNRVIDDRLGLG